MLGSTTNNDIKSICAFAIGAPYEVIEDKDLGVISKRRNIAFGELHEKNREVGTQHPKASHFLSVIGVPFSKVPKLHWSRAIRIRHL